MPPAKGTSSGSGAINKSAKVKQFKPPRPSTSTAASASVTKSTARRQSRPTRRPSPSPSPGLSSSSSPPPQTSRSKRQSKTTTTNQNQPQAVLHKTPLLPEKLLKVMLKHHFQDADTGIGTDAVELVGKYLDTFVREALARAKYEKEAAGQGGEDFLEVEELEKLGPQLVLDF